MDIEEEEEEEEEDVAKERGQEICDTLNNYVIITVIGFGIIALFVPSLFIVDRNLDRSQQRPLMIIVAKELSHCSKRHPRQHIRNIHEVQQIHTQSIRCSHIGHGVTWHRWYVSPGTHFRPDKFTAKGNTIYHFTKLRDWNHLPVTATPAASLQSFLR